MAKIRFFRIFAFTKPIYHETDFYFYFFAVAGGAGRFCGYGRHACRAQSLDDRDVPVVAIVPEGVSAAEPCPVVYLLHGYSGDETAWLKIKPSLPAIADRERIAFICPGVGNSWYLDSKVREKSLYETFMIRELLPAVEARYPVVRDRSGRAITGLSMGGFGAMSLAIKHKGLFGAAGSTSGGLDIRPFPQNWETRSCWARLRSIPKPGKRLRPSTSSRSSGTVTWRSSSTAATTISSSR